MEYSLKSPASARQNIFIGIIVIGILLCFTTLIKPESKEANINWSVFSFLEEPDVLAKISQNALLPIVSPTNPITKNYRKIPVIVTAYSSTPWETEGDPFLTASGTWVRDGIIANNYLSFGTKVRMPELYGDKIFVVEDRMSWKKGNYHIDIWFPSYWEALNFGAKITYIEIL